MTGTLVLLFAAPAPADPARDALLARLQERQRGVRTLSASFEQTRHLSLLTRPARSRGRLLVRWEEAGGSRGPVVRWDLTEPEAVIHRLRAEELLTAYPADREAERVRLPPSFAPFLGFVGRPSVTPEAQDLFDIVRMGDGAPVASGAFRFAEEETGGAVTGLSFRPRDKGMARKLQEVRLLLDPERLWIVRLAVVEPNGDRTEVAFTDVRENVPVDDAAFEPDLAGYTVRDDRLPDAQPQTRGSESRP